MDYIIKVTKEGTFIPRGIGYGEYKLVPVEQVGAGYGRIRIDELPYEYYLSKNNNDLVGLRNALCPAGYCYFDEFEEKDVAMMMEKVRNVGFNRTALLIALCLKFDISIIFSEEKYGKRALKYKDCIVKLSLDSY